MRKAIGLLVLVIGVAVVASPELSSVGAQDKSKTKAKKDSAAPAVTGTVEIHKGKDGYRFRIKNEDGKTIAMATRGHETKEECLQVLEEVKTILSKAKPTEVKD